MSGESLADAMRDSGGFFPPLMCELLDVGERTGRLDAALLRLADHYDHTLKLRRTLLLAVAWPLIELTIAILVVGILILVNGVLGQRPGGENIDLLGFGLAGWRGLAIYLMIIMAAAAAIGAPALAAARGRVSPPAMRLAMQIPKLGQWLEEIALERMTWSLAMALEAGIDAQRSISLAVRSTQNPLYIAQLDQIQRLIVAGSEFHETLRSTGVFPDEFLDALETAELSGTESESLSRLSAQYQERVKASANLLTVVTTVVVFGLVALILIMLIVRLAMFYIGAIYGGLQPI
jgi:type II secretory pathway component PulF